MELANTPTTVGKHKVIDHQHSGKKRLQSNEEKTGIYEPEDKVDIKFRKKHEKSSPNCVIKGVAKGTKVMSKGFAKGVGECGEIFGKGIGTGAKVMGEGFAEGVGECGEIFGKGIGTGAKVMGEGMGTGFKIMGRALFGAPIAMIKSSFSGMKDGIKSIIQEPSLKKIALMAGFGGVGIGLAAVAGAAGAGILGYAVLGPVFFGLGGRIASDLDRSY
jgi:hypothetical protein